MPGLCVYIMTTVVNICSGITIFKNNDVLQRKQRVTPVHDQRFLLFISVFVLF